MKKLFLLFLLFASTISLQAENDVRKHGLSYHLGGSVSLYEFEYQYKFLIINKHSLSASVAISSAAINVGFPVGINYVYGQQEQLLIGVRFSPDVLLLSFDEEVVVPYWNYFINLRIGYGREILLFKHPYTFYIFASPILSINSGKFLPWAGIGFTHYF